MLDKPPLEDEKIRVCLRATYGVNVTEIEFLPIGYDANASVFRVVAEDGCPYFLKAKRNEVNPLSLSIPRYLQAQGIEQVVAPLPTITADLWGSADEYALLLYPFINGESDFNAVLTDNQWLEYGAVVKRIHETQPSPELWEQMSKETFVPPDQFTNLVPQLKMEISNKHFVHPIEKQLVDFWNAHLDEINCIVERTDQLSRALQGKPSNLVLCHADIHKANLLIEPNGKLHVVDWDEVVLAPIERDLMFVIDKPGDDLFFQGYGKTDVDKLTLAYYCYERLLEDVSSLAEFVLMEVSDESKQDAMGWFIVNFAPGSEIDKADKLYRQLSME